MITEVDMGIQWTERQRQALDIRDKNLLVSAAAGSGKTAVLIERIKNQVIGERVPVTEFLIVTFTNAAAAEMKEKLVKAITGAMSAECTPPEDRAFLREQMDLIRQSHISTFHAFAMDVIRRHFQLISVDPDFRICDNGQQELLQGEAMDEMFEDLFREGNEDFFQFLKRYSGSRSEDEAKAMIRETYTFIQSIPDRDQWLEQQVEAIPETVEKLRDSAVYAEACTQAGTDLARATHMARAAENLLRRAGLERLAEKLKEDVQTLSDAQEAFRESYEKGVLTCGQVSFVRLSPLKTEKETLETVKEDVNRLRKAYKDLLADMMKGAGSCSLEEEADCLTEVKEAWRTILGLVRGFSERYGAKKKKKRLLDFSDIEHMALAILVNPEAAEEYRAQFRYIYIDEYQDSNMVQETLISRIKRENNVFMVGDVKQSIYKFRLAEPAIFLEKYDRFGEAGEEDSERRVDLNQNFRSKRPIINFVNRLFEKIMTVENSGLAYDENAALYPGIEAEESLLSPVELHLLEEKPDGDGDGTEGLREEIRSLKKTEAEAALAAQIIKEKIGQEFFDAKAGVIRPLQKRDMVILLRSASGLANRAEVFYQALLNQGIPAYMDTGDGFFDTIEVGCFVNLLRVIDNKKQDVPLLSVLVSPIFSFTLKELAGIRLLHKAGSFEEAFAACAEAGTVPGQDSEPEPDANPEPQPDGIFGQGGEPLLETDLPDKCRRALERLKEWNRRSRFLSLQDLIWSILTESGYYDYVCTLPAGDQRRANLRLLAERAGAYEESQSRGLFGFIRYVETLQARSVPAPQMKLLSEGEDLVRIMTVHKSKGLEFPVVMVAGLNGQFHRESGKKGVSLHKDLGVGLHYVEENRRYTRRTFVKTVIDRKKAEEARAEELRVLYVALTRAQDRLILLGTVDSAEAATKAAGFREPSDVMSAGSFLELVLPVALGDTALRKVIHSRGELYYETPEERRTAWGLHQRLEQGFQDVDPCVAEKTAARLEWKYPHGSSVLTKSKFSVSELNRAEGGVDSPSAPVSLRIPAFLAEKKAFTAAERGTILHRLMEQIPFTPEGKTMEEIRNFGDSLVEKEILTAEELSAADLHAVERFFRSGLGQRVCHAEELYKEAAFNLRSEMDGEPIIIQGVIDCFFREGNRWILVDYKSNRVDDSEEGDAAIREKYRVQMDYYRKALEEIRGIRVDEAYLYLFRQGREVSMLEMD